MKLFNVGKLIMITVIIVGLSVCPKCSDGFVSLFDGKTLNNWKVPEGDNGHWKIIDGVIDYDGGSEVIRADRGRL